MSDQSNAVGDDTPGSAIPLDPRRLEAFSDGVMAVIITIMAFEFKTPATANWHGLEGRVPLLLVYVLSFTAIGIYWNNHHHLLRATRRISSGVMWSNLTLLFWLSLTPFATEWVGNDHTRALPAATYGVVALGSALAFYVLVRAIIRANADDGVVARTIGRNVKGIVSPVIYVAGIGLAAVSPYLSYACYVCVSLMWFIPDRRLTRAA
jgi:uncharacterized membrane protein